MLKNNKGITLVALIIIVIIMIILVGVGINIGMDAVERTKLEDLKTNMLSIKTKAKTIQEKYSFGDIESLVGEKIEDTSVLKEELVNLLPAGETVYEWNKQILEEQALKEIQLAENAFYIVYYNEGEATCEVYYSEGFEYEGKTYYSLTDLQTIQEDN